jgi:4-hydroxy-3-polyprenylbenzoate decarboxylase
LPGLAGGWPECYHIPELNYSDPGGPEQAEKGAPVLNSEQAAPRSAPFRTILAITGASGAIYGVRLLERLRRPGIEIHLLVSPSGLRTLELETGRRLAELKALADYHYPVADVGARLASGSYPIDAMVIAPCSIRTMSAIAAGLSSNLLLRAADVTLKERRKLILMVRESPLHLGHLRTMAALAEMGAVIAPPIPAFYHRPQTVLELVDYSVERVMDLLGAPAEDARRWDPR